jgi:DNA-binding beta-propeller fold protein YncE
VPLPEHVSGGFDHGDAHAASGRVFVAHTANDTVEVINGERLALEQTLVACPEGSGVLCTQDERPRVFAAARGNGTVLVFDANTCDLLRRIEVGPRPNGLAWDPLRGQLLVADVEQHDARLVDPETGACVATVGLPGRPRWCVYDSPRERFLVNIREPACVMALSAHDLQPVCRIDGLPNGPHGLDLDLDQTGQRAFVACDAAMLAVIDLSNDHELGRIPFSGEPDAIWWNPHAGRLYVAIGQPGVIEVIDGRSLSVVEQVATEEGAHTTAFDHQRQRLYVFLPQSCHAAVYEEVASGGSA